MTADPTAAKEMAKILIQTGIKGKPNAWNLLRREAQYNHVIFVDGDVTLDNLAISNLAV